MLNKIRVNELLDSYEDLLTDKQKILCRYYYREDLSLQEIAELEKISRAAVYDTIRRSRDELHRYEDILHLCQLGERRNRLYQKLRSHCDSEGKKLLEQAIDMEGEIDQK